MTGRYRDIEPEDLIVSHQASDTDHRQQSPWDSDARILEESNKSLQGQHEAPSVADGVWLSKDANLDPNHLEPQDTWQWQGQKNTTLWEPGSGYDFQAIRTQDLREPRRRIGHNVPGSTTIIKPGVPRTPEPQTLLQYNFPFSDVSLHAPYYSTLSILPNQAFNLEHRTESLRHSHLRPRGELDKVQRTTRSKALEDVGLGSQLDEDARSTKAEELGLTGPQPSVHNEPQHPFVLLEPQIEGSSSLGTSSKSFICPVCNQQFRTRTHAR